MPQRTCGRQACSQVTCAIKQLVFSLCASASEQILEIHVEAQDPQLGQADSRLYPRRGAQTAVINWWDWRLAKYKDVHES